MPKKTRKKPRPEPTYQGMNREQLAREIGLEELTYEACLKGLFGNLLDELPTRPTSRPRGAARVTQMGPGRRQDPKKTS